MESSWLPAKIEHTLLRPEATSAQIEDLCREALQYNFVGICVLPIWVARAAEFLKKSPVRVCTVVGFPLGGNTSRIKALETTQAIEDGADEVDMVINLGALKSMEDDLVREDIQTVVRTARSFGAPEARGKTLVKVILETALLNRAEIIRACHLARDAGADLVKTSTGFGPGGATVEAVRCMREAIGTDMGIKASGGIRTLEAALALLEVGATRLGTSAGVALVQEWRARREAR
ncbi:MAG: deoxyribose-phosphate aldolase [Syntrophomonadaceae bacterium]|nr:deoxyribose-phosphate aldolase [Syntrophomonadaceae bacterium]